MEIRDMIIDKIILILSQICLYKDRGGGRLNFRILGLLRIPP